MSDDKPNYKLLEAIYLTVYKEMLNYDIETKKNPIKESKKIPIELSEKQAFIIQNVSEELGISHSDVLCILLDMQLDRIRQFIDLYSYADILIEDEEAQQHKKVTVDK